MNCKVDTKVRIIPPAIPGWSLMMFESWLAFRRQFGNRSTSLMAQTGASGGAAEWLSVHSPRLHPRSSPGSRSHASRSLLPGLGPRSPAELGRRWKAPGETTDRQIHLQVAHWGGTSFDSVAKLQNARSSEEERGFTRRRCTKARAVEGEDVDAERPGCWQRLETFRDSFWLFLCR